MSRSDVELAYRADALRAARAGYVPADQRWTEDEQGFLLAVTYGLASEAPARSEGENQPATEAGQRAESATGQRAESAIGQRAGAQAEFAAAARADDRYEPPPETYDQPADLFVAVKPSAEERPPADEKPEPPAENEASAVSAPDLLDQPSDAFSRSTRLTIQTLDLHAGGEPLRIIRSGFPDVPHVPVLDRRQWVADNADHVRRTLMQEPRGHRDMYGAILLPPYDDHADMTVLFMHNEGYSTMCGHGIIAITTGLIEEGLFPATEPVTTIRYEVPAGIVAANAATKRLDDGSWAVRGVRFTNVPAYLAAQSLSLRPDGIELHGAAAQYGALGVDLAFGGAYYGIVNAAELGLRVVPEQATALRRAGAAITDVLRRDHTPAHPTDPALGFVYGTIIVDLDPRSSPDGKGGGAHIRNATIFADAELDRSPCGSGTSALLAQLHARGRIRAGQEIVNASITGEHFLGRIEAETSLGPYPAVTTSIAGTAFVTGYSTFVVDSRDPLGEGFLLS
jgi:proline racemase